MILVNILYNYPVWRLFNHKHHSLLFCPLVKYYWKTRNLPFLTRVTNC